MENSSRKIGLRVTAGILVAVTIIVAVFASGISLPGQESKTGRLTVLLMDAPVNVDELWITVTGVAVHKVGNEEVQTEVVGAETDGEDDGGGWVSIDLSGADPNEIHFDLLKYRMDNEGENSVVLSLADGETAEGSYNKIRLNVTEAEAVYYKYDEQGNVVMNGDEPEIEETKTLRVPPNHIDVITKFTIDEQNPVVVLIDMQPDWVAISNSGNLRPVMKAIVSQNNPDAQIETIET